MISLRRTVLIVGMVHLVLAVVVSYKFNWHISGLIRINFSSAQMRQELMSPDLVVLTQSTGFDGKEHYFVAVDPFPGPGYPTPYRLKRILYPLASHIIACGKREWLPAAMFIVNLLAVLAGTLFIGKTLQCAGRPPVWAIIYGLSIGEIVGLKYSLTSPLALGLAAGGMYFWHRNRAIASAVFFSLSLLSNEYTLVIPVILALNGFFLEKQRVRAMILAASPLPWIAYVFFITRLYTQRAVTDAGAIFAPPLQGIIDIIHHLNVTPPWRHFFYNDVAPLIFAGIVAMIVISQILRLKNGIAPYPLLVLYYIAFALFLKEDCWRIINISRYLSAVFPLMIMGAMTNPNRIEKILAAGSILFSLLAIIGVLVEPRVPFILWH